MKMAVMYMTDQTYRRTYRLSKESQFSLVMNMQVKNIVHSVR